MRHGRSKAARKTLKYFERTVNLKSKPYYSVLLDATFLTAMIRITTNTSNSDTVASNSQHQQNDSSDEIASRIERVLQVGGGGTVSHHHGSRHDNDNDHSNHQHNDSNDNNTNTGTATTRYNVRYFIPQEAVTELELIVASLKEKSTMTKKKKKCREYLQKAQLFIDALDWIHRNSYSKKQKNAYHKEQRLNNQNQAAHYYHHGGDPTRTTTNSTGGNSSFGSFSRCEILPKLLLPPTEKQKQNKKKSTTSSSTDKDNTNNDEDTDEETDTIADVGITATDAVRRHIARDDIDTDNDATTTTITTGSTRQQKRRQRTYIVGTQEDDLLDELRSLGTVPIIRLANKASVLIVENPSKKGQRSEYGNEQQKWFGNTLGETEKAMVDAAWKLKRREEKETATTIAAAVGSGGNRTTGRGNTSNNNNSNQKQKQRGTGGNKAKGPNPLSCKRKRSDGDGNGNSNSNHKTSSSSSSSKKRRERGQRKKEKESVLLEQE